MLIVNIVGGLGNQMYGYALYRTLFERGRNVFMDISFYTHQNSPVIDFRKYLLPRIFHIEERLNSGFTRFMMRAERKLKLLKTYNDKNDHFQPEVLNMKHGILNGYWQSFKYSQEIEDILRKEFTFRKPLTGKSAQVIDEIRNCTSVSISVRRGDYVKLGFSLPDEYYFNAIKYIQTRIPDAKFFCTSDDIDWCKNTFRDYNFSFIDWSEGDDQYFDMQVISECKYNILANSTFCLWGAWLNQNPDKIVMRPETWGTPSVDRRKDFWPEDWVSIPSNKEN